MVMGTGRVLTGVGLAAVSAAVVVALLANTSNPPSGQSASPELRVPQALAGTPILTSSRGQAALTEVSRLHGTTIDAVDALVPRYEDGTTLWISAPRPQELRGRPVFVTQGAGQVHYYYQSGTRVLWLGVPPGPHTGAAIEAVLELYP